MDERVKNKLIEEQLALLNTLHDTDPTTENYRKIWANFKSTEELLHSEEKTKLKYELAQKKSDEKLIKAVEVQNQNKVKFWADLGSRLLTNTTSTFLNHYWWTQCLGFEQTGAFTSPLTKKMITGINFNNPFNE